jgi:hypothetical protein
MLSKQQLPRFFFLTSILFGNLCFIPIALGQNRPPQTFSNRLPDRWESSEFRPPASGIPSRMGGGGSRNPSSSCISSGQVLPTALVPVSSFGGITQEPYPQISWYLPPNRAEGVEIIIFNEQDQEVYSTWYALKPTASPQQNLANPQPSQLLDQGKIMSLQIPPNAGINPLEIGKLYRWEVSLICDMNNRTRDIPTGGYIQRIPPKEGLNTQLEQATPPDQAVLYANAQLWYETLATVIKMQRQSSQDPILAANINTMWVKLLTSAGLENVAEQPVFLGAANYQQNYQQ